MDLPKRCATTGANSRPMRVEPVALTTGMRASFANASPASRRPSTTWLRCAGAAPDSAGARSNRAWQARAVSGVFSLGFQIVLSPQTQARQAFHAHTPTGKLKAEITATGP